MKVKAFDSWSKKQEFIPRYKELFYVLTEV